MSTVSGFLQRPRCAIACRQPKGWTAKLSAWAWREGSGPAGRREMDFRDHARRISLYCCGYIPGTHKFDALLMGVYQGKDLVFVAKVKNGFVPRIQDELFPSLKALQTAQCPFRNLPEKRASRWGESLTAEKMEQCRWIKPKLVCQVAFMEWTDAGHLRHCTFVGMRDDKEPAEVVRET